jgi:hypothetical protein
MLLSGGREGMCIYHSSSEAVRIQSGLEGPGCAIVTCPSVTNDPDLTIDPDNDDDDLELYGAPVRPPVKPRFIDMARLANAWCQHYPETAQQGIGGIAEHQNVAQNEDDRRQCLAYPSPPPQYEHFDPIFYPVPWDNNPVLVHLRDEPPRGRHEEVIREPQNEAGPLTHTDEATPEARGNSPPWRHLRGGFYEWYTRPGRFDDEEQPRDEENVPERGSNANDDADYLVTRTRRYKRNS